MPVSLRDEGSPFNECTHAYLAATRALLLHMNGMPGSADSVRSLASRIDDDMLRNSTALMLCRYSEEAFDTATFISPRWREIPFHLPTLAAFIGMALAMIGGLRLILS